MSTIYTLNGKVLKNAANDKWLIKPPPPKVFPVTIGSQIWSSKNLAIDDGNGGIYTQTVNYGQGDVVEYYYTWAAAVRVAATVPGWHLPSNDEWTALANAVGSSTAGTKLKSTYGWNVGNGTDDYGFSVFPAGYRKADGSFTGLGTYAYFWTATEYSSSSAYRNAFYSGASMLSYYENKSLGYSVRLVKDE